MGNKTVLVTGSKGLLGSAIHEASTQFTGYDFCFASRTSADLTSFDQTLALFDQVKPDVVIHAAALVGGIQGNTSKPVDFFTQNTTIDMNVVRAAKHSGVDEFVAFLSSCIFPDEAIYPLDYSQLHQGPPHQSNYGYAFAKRSLDVLVDSYRRQYGFNFKLFIPTNLYGPHDNFDLVNSHVIPGLIHRFFLASKTGTPPVIWGDGSPLREFVFAKDAAHFILSSLGTCFEEPVFLNANGIERSILDVANILADLFGLSGQIEFDASKPGGQLRKPTANGPWVLATLGHQQVTPLEIALKETVTWFSRNYPNVRGAKN